MFTDAVQSVLTLDIFKQMLNQCKDPQTRKRLCSYARGFLEMMQQDCAEKWLQKQPVVAKAFQEGIDFASCVTFLLDSPRLGLSIDCVRAYTEYKGPNAFRKAVRSLLKSAEPSGPSFTQIKADSRKLLQELAMDAFRTAATSEEALPLANKLLNDLQESDRDVKPGCCAALAAALAELGGLEKKLRKGSTDSLATEMCSFTREIVAKAPDLEG